jgi:hypothetical protein
VIGHLEDTLDGTSHVTNIQAADYRAMLGRTLAPPYVATNQRQEDIVNRLLLPSQPGQSYPGSIGINYTFASNPDGSFLANTPTFRTITYVGTEYVGAEIDKLATMQGGFDWGMEPWSTGLAGGSPGDPVGNFYLWYPQRGVTKSFTAEYGANVASVKRVVDSTAFANQVLMTGATGTAAQTASGDVWTNPQLHAEGAWQVAKADSNTSDTGLLLAEAQYELGFDSNLTPSYQLTLMPGAWISRDDCWLGDSVRVKVSSGRLAVDANMRIVQIDFDIDDAGNEKVSLTVARPPLTLSKVLGDQSLNLYQLNRR